MRVIVSAVVAVLSAVVASPAGTWRLERGRDWKPLSEQSREDKYLLAVAEIKKLVNTGQTQAVGEALDELKGEFPEVAGPDLDAFMEAEMLLCEGKFAKAVRSYNKFLAEHPDSEFYEAALDRQFAIATAYLAGQKRSILSIFKIKGYAAGVRIMERISDRVGLDTVIGSKAALAVAKSYERRKRFNEAYLKWSEISSQWETGQIGKDALLAKARCKYAAYRGSDYDASNLISARSYYENFKLRYLEDAEEIGVDKKLKQIDEQLADKQFSIGQYYQKTGNRQSANLYYEMVVRNWPNSMAAKMAKERLEDSLTYEKEEK